MSEIERTRSVAIGERPFRVRPRPARKQIDVTMVFIAFLSFWFWRDVNQNKKKLHPTLAETQSTAIDMLESRGKVVCFRVSFRHTHIHTC